MTDEAQRWKEKYLKSIEDQEKLERRWNARLDLLRLGLVRSTLAAEGSDKAVDQCMKEMREVVRSDNMDAALAQLIPRLERTVLDSEQRREARMAQIATALNALVDQLQTLPLPRETAKPLKKFAHGLEKRIGQSRELPLLLSELSALQGAALTSLDPVANPARPGLLERLFGHRDEPSIEPEAFPTVAPVARAEAETESAMVSADSPTIADAPAANSTEPAARVEVPLHPQPDSLAAQASPEIELAPVTAARDTIVVEPLMASSTADSAAEEDPEPEPSEVDAASLTVETEPAVTPHVLVEVAPQSCPKVALTPAALDILPLPLSLAEALSTDPEAQTEGYSLAAHAEPTYSSVATHIESTLLKMLDDLVLPQKLLEKADSMRERLDHGLNWYELLPLLDDLAAMVLAISDNGQQELQRYLEQINERLAWFHGQLQVASLDHAESQDQARQLDTELREQVGGLHESVAATADADGLKRLLESRLDGLLGSVDEHRRRREAREQEVAERMRGLSERVANMEREAEAYRNVLEEQRQKALLDPLTGLSNRAGLSERLEALAGRLPEDDTPIQLAIMDLDHFKSINDGYGHLAGDRVLKIVADQLRRQLREGDFLARFGGEEFVALFPGATPEVAGEVLEKMRQVIEACPFHFKGMRIVVTVSVGTTAVKPRESTETALKRADQALYRAKDGGRNRIERA
ncbi:GGDEF domain-containing protein [Pseudomonas massiliensis]|uniref:GGDEF domain-containing protein n=1 Tax=Pseudomonas massiliensis TaxID=522492 RepID=UPI00058CCFB3|nr:GGDEF domain-containing protein [Pseudomonas massiliensis]